MIIHEQMGDYLFNENMVKNLLDLKKRLLKKNGKILPGKFELYLEPVQLEESYDVPFIWENKLYGVDFEFLEHYFETLDKYQPSDYKIEWLESDSVKQFLGHPEPILTFDLNELPSEKDLPRNLKITKQLESGGMFNGFCLYFKAIFDDEICFDTSPLTENTHWGNCFFRIENRKCTGKETVKYEFSMGDLLDIHTWSLSISKFFEKVPNELTGAD